MNRAVTGQSQPGARENVAYLTSTERRRDYETQQAYEKREYDVSGWSRNVYLLECVEQELGISLSE